MDSDTYLTHPEVVIIILPLHVVAAVEGANLHLLVFVATTALNKMALCGIPTQTATISPGWMRTLVLNSLKLRNAAPVCATLHYM